MNILLCGFMGCGKSLISKKLASKTSFCFVDIDREIEKEVGESIANVFSKKGELYFRELEKNTLIKLLENDNLVISTGGGTVVNKECAELIAKDENSVLLFIDTPLRALQERLKFDKRRPLLQREDRSEFIETLYKQRYPIYKRVADVSVNGAGPPNVIVNRIIEIIEAKSFF